MTLHSIIQMMKHNTAHIVRFKLKAKCLVLILLAAFAIYADTAQAQMRWNSAYQNYIDEYKDLAIEQMLKHRIPASITLAQGLLESGAGRSSLATRGNNHFGIKCHDWKGASMRRDDDAPNECFRVYDSPRESYEDHSKFLQRKRYQRLFSLSITDYKGWARGLKACGYATNPRYAEQLISVIELYKLHQYDKAKNYDKFRLEHSGGAIGLTHAIYSYNKNYYIKVRKGDTLNGISKEVGISVRKLAKYNEIDRDAILHPGDVIYMKKKQKHATKEYKKRTHRVRAGESMYSIAQFYGMRLKYLYKKNNLDPDYTPRIGDELVVY